MDNLLEINNMRQFEPSYPQEAFISEGFRMLSKPIIGHSTNHYSADWSYIKRLAGIMAPTLWQQVFEGLLCG